MMYHSKKPSMRDSNEEPLLQYTDAGKKSVVYRNSEEEEQQHDHTMWGGGGSSFSLSCLENEKAPQVRRVEPLAADMDVADLMYKIGHDQNWAIDEIEQDIKVLRRNRLRTVKDLRSMSEYGWSELKELLPIVKDRLRSEVGCNGSKTSSRAGSFY
jgi:hypothetical protein